MRNPITDPLARQWWRDYQRECRDGNPLGLSFTEYVAHRVLSLGFQSLSMAPSAPWYVSSCGHQHPWGVTCDQVTVTQ